MEEFDHSIPSEQRDQSIQEVKKILKLVFMNHVRMCDDGATIDIEFMLQSMNELANDEDKIREEANILSINRDIFTIALSQILELREIL